MQSHGFEKVSQQLIDAGHEVTSAASPHEVKQCLVAVIQHLGEVVRRIETSMEADGPWSEEHSLHQRAIDDYDGLQRHLASVATTLADEGRFVWMLRNRGNDLAAARAHMATVQSLDHAISHLVHLMQFDTAERMEVDIRNGFQFTSGSMNYGRMYL